MDSNQKQPDILENLFRQMPEEELPASFRLNVMQQIAKETVKVKKRNEWFGLALQLRWECWEWLSLSSSTWISRK